MEIDPETQQDRRTSKRHPVQVTAVANGSGVLTVDLSQGGACFVSAEEPGDFKVGDLVELTVSIKQATSKTLLHYLGRVMRRDSAPKRVRVALRVSSIHLDDPSAADALLREKDNLREGS